MLGEPTMERLRKILFNKIWVPCIRKSDNERGRCKSSAGKDTKRNNRKEQLLLKSAQLKWKSWVKDKNYCNEALETRYAAELQYMA